MSVFQDLSKHTLIYGVGIVLSRAAGFFMIPIYTRFLAPKDYGILELLDLFAYVVGILVAMAIRSSVNRFYYDSEEEGARRKIIVTAFLSSTVVSLAVAGLMLPFAGSISYLIFQSGEFGAMVGIVLLTFWVNTMAEIGFVHLQAQQKSVLYAVLSVAKLVVSLSLNIYFLVVLRMGVEGVLISGLISGGVFAVVMTRRILGSGGIDFSMPALAAMLRYGLPLVPASLATYVLHFSDRFFLERLASLDDVGIYSLGYKFGMVFAALMTGPFISIWVPKRYEIAKNRDARDIYRRAYTYFNLFICFGALGLSAFSRELVAYVADPAYRAGWQVIPLVAFAYVFDSWIYHFNTGFHLGKKTTAIAWLNIVSAGVNLVLNYFLIRQWGGLGAALATLATFGIKSAMYHVAARRTWDVDFAIGKNLRAFAAAALLVSAAVALPAAWGGWCWAAKSLLVLSYPAWLLALGCLELSEARVLWTAGWNALLVRRGLAVGNGRRTTP
jgi:O-antigen/teichoic acid export membrane protein